MTTAFESPIVALAYSEEPFEDELPQQQSWRTTLLLVAAIAAVAGAVWLWALSLSHNESASLAMPSTTVSEAVNPSSPLDQVVQQQVVVPDATPLSVDQRFLGLMQRRGDMAPSGDSQDLIAAAHQVCGAHTKGFSNDQIIDGLHPDDPSVTYEQKAFFVDLSINTYCN